MVLSSFGRVSWAALVAVGLLAGCGGDDSGSGTGAGGSGGPGGTGGAGGGGGGHGEGGEGGTAIPQTFWSERFGDSEDQWSAGVAVDGSGQIYTAGTFDGTLDLGTGAELGPVDNALFAAHFDSTGRMVWGSAFDGDDLVGAMSVTADRVGNMFFSGGFFGSLSFGGGLSVETDPSVSASSLFVTKLDPAGNAVWAKSFGVWDPDGEIGHADVAVDANGLAAVAGWLEGTAQFGGTTVTSAGGVDVLVAKFNSVGPVIWAKAFGDSVDQIAEGVATDPAGDVVVAGRFEGVLNFGGGALAPTSGGMFVAKLGAADGAHVWSKGFGFAPDGTSEPHGTLVAGATLDSTGNVLVWGRLAGTLDLGDTELASAQPASNPDGFPVYDMFVVKLDPNGTVLWGKVFGDDQSQGGLRAVRADPMDNVVLTGALTGTVDFGGGELTASGPSDLFVVKLARDTGSFLSAEQYGDDSAQSASGLALYGNGIVLSGDLQGTADLGYGPLTSAGQRDVLLARLPAP